MRAVDETLTGRASREEARTYMEEAYRRSGDEAAAEHPLAVAHLLDEDGQPARLVLAGLLHDLLEDTHVSAAELRERFAPDVTDLVEALTQDSSISGYQERKAALRQQIVDAGSEAATVALADKSAKLQSEQRRPKERKLAHYRATLEQIEERYGHSRLSELLRRELARFPEL